MESPKDLKAVAKALAELLRRYDLHITEKGYGAHLDRHAKEHKDVAGTLDRIPTGVGGSAPSTSSYVTISAEAGLSSERRVAAGTGIGLTDGGANSTLSIAVAVGIADDKILQVDDAAAADNDYAKFTADGIEGRSYAETISDLGALTTAAHTAIGDSAPHHTAVTLAADADELLSLTGQAIGFDTQTANQVLAGPTTGAAADPDFRALVAADIPDVSATYVPKALFDAQSVLAATADNTPAALVVAEQEVVGRLTGANVDGIALGIADNNVVQIDDAAAADNEFAKFTAAGLEGRTYAEVKQDLDLEDADIKALAVTGVEAEATLDLTGDVTVAANKTLAVDTIKERTGGAGVTIEGLLLKDAQLYVGSEGVYGDLTIHGSPTPGHAGGTFQLNLSDDSDGTFDDYSIYPWDDDLCVQGGNGQVDLMLVNDGTLKVIRGPLQVDHINEYTAGHGIVLDGVELKDDAVETDAIRGLRETSGPTALTVGTITDGEFLKRVGATIVSAAAAGGGAPTDADYLVGTANAGLSAEIVVGATPGGELGGTWASPTVDATHSGSAHSAYVANSLYDAQSILAATADNTPAAVTVAEQRVVGRLTGGNIDDITIGIADDNILQVDQASTADDNDYAKFTANGIEGRSYAEVVSDLGLKTVATDTIWAAAGDLAVGTGNDTAGVLTKGADDKVLTMVAGAVAWAAAAGGGGVSDAAFSF